jgi:ubiquitin carboxyl-terminal hydrolase 14
MNICNTVAPPAAPSSHAAALSAMDVDTTGMDEEEAAALAEALRLSMGEDAPAATESASAASTESGAKADAPPPAPASAQAEGDSTSAKEAAPTGPVEVGKGLPVGFTGQYELHAIVTHKGRSADSGHYIGWVRQGPGSAMWWCYNDDKVTEVRTEEVMKLGGDGADRDMAYLNFYRFRDNTEKK